MMKPEKLGELSLFFSAEFRGASHLAPGGGKAELAAPDRYREVMLSEIKRCRGRVVDAGTDSVLAEFRSMTDAVNCCVEIRQQLARYDLEPPRIGVTWDDAAQARLATAGQGQVAAERLRMEAQPGEMLVRPTFSPVPTIRIGARDEPAGRRRSHFVFAALQLSLLLAYFLIWYGLITVKTVNIALYGSFCWPKFMCDDKTPHPVIRAGEQPRSTPRPIGK